MATSLEDLKAAVAAEGTVVSSIVVLVDGLADKLSAALAANADPAELAQIIADIKAQTESLSAEVVKNTPADPTALQA